MTLWQGRFSGSLNEAATQLNRSLPVDCRLGKVDILGSMAWAKALAQAGVLESQEYETICQGLSQVLQEWEDGTLVYQHGEEDIHSAVERRLIELVGAVGGKLHTGRSRNDQVATDFRLWMLHQLPELEAGLIAVQRALLGRAESDLGVLIPGYTHLQQAQPLLLSQWWLAHFWALQRDRQRLGWVRRLTSVMPLGSAALAGSAFEIDRQMLADELGFATPSLNSVDAVSDRDFALEALFWAALVGVHLSRLAEALILYSTVEYGFVALDDAYATGSSLMPQKKNPDLLELARGKCGGLIGRLTGLLCTLKGLPSAYDKDLQEDKAPVFEAVDTLLLLLPVMGGVIRTLKVNAERMQAAIHPTTLATDLADYLVHKGMPFRQAHQAVGMAVQRAEALGVALPEMPLAEWQAMAACFDESLYQLFNPHHAVAKRTVQGGTARQPVLHQIEQAKRLLGESA